VVAAIEIALLRTSSARQNKIGDKGSPYQTPQEQEKKPTALLFTSTDNRVDCKITKIQFTNVSTKPNPLRTSSKKL